MSRRADRGAGSSRLQGGLSLLEMMVAVAILATSMTLLYQVQAGLLRGTEDLTAARKANLLLRSLLDSRDAVPAMGWAESGESAGLRWEVRSRLQPLPSGYPEAATRLHDVTIEITWRGRRGPGQLVVTTVLPQAAPVPPKEAG